MFKNYLKIAFRNLRKHKGFTLINLTGLSIGISCFILIAVYILDEFSYDTFHTNADRVYRVLLTDKDDATDGTPRIGGPWAPVIKQDFPEVEAYTRVIYFGNNLMRYGENAFFERGGLAVDSTFFEVFSFELMEGNPETMLNEPYTLVLTETFAKKYFGDENPVGKTIQVDNDQSFRVTGLVKDIPQQSHFDFDFLTSLDSHNPWFRTEWYMTNYYTYLLLKPDVQPASLEAKFPQFVDKYVKTENRFNSEVSLQPLTSIHLHSHYHREMGANGDMNRIYVLSAIALFLLLIASINFVNLATARSAKRAREVGIRKVIGARKKQLIFQFVGESVMICVIALFFSLAIADLSLPWFNSLTGKPLDISYLGQPGLLVSLFLGAIFLGIMAGIYPAFFLSAFKPIEVLSGGGRAKSGKSVIRQGLVIFQFVISAVLIFATLVIYDQLSFLTKKDLGFNKNELLVLRIPDQSISSDLDVLRNQWLQKPEIASIGATSGLMGGGDWGMPLKYEGGGPDDRFSPRIFAVDPEYVSTHEMEMVKGRDFSREISSDLAGAFIINESAARQLNWENPVGKYLERPATRTESGEWIYKRGMVVGVVKDFHYHSLREQIEPMAMYIDSSQVSYLMVRLSPENMEETLEFMTESWEAQIAAYPIDYFFLDRIFDTMYRPENQLGKVIGVFAGLIVVIACMGLFGLVAFTTERRTKEIGIRKVLGASIQQLILLLSKDIGKLVVIALVVAAVPAWLITQKWLEQFAYKTPLKPSVFLLTILILAGLTAITLFYHVMKAASENPVNALRDE